MIVRPVYPAELEQWWLAEARRLLGGRGTLIDLGNVAGALSDRFTTARADGPGPYLDDDRGRAAYGLFFAPQTHVRTLFCLDEVLHRSGWRPPHIDLRIADLGAGTGSAGFALADRFDGLVARLRLSAFDSSAAALDTAKRIVEANTNRWPQLSFSTVPGDLAAFVERSDAWDVIVASFALNERFEREDDATTLAWMNKALDRLAPGGLLLIVEPASPKTSLRLQKFRDAVAGWDGFRVLAPCLHGQACPMLARADGSFCHEVRSWRPPESLRDLNRHLFRSIHLLKFSFVAVARAPFPAAAVDPDAARMVSPLMALKGRFRGDVCAADGAIRCHEVLARGEAKALKEAERGDTIVWRNRRELGDGLTTRAETAERTFGFE